jgi:GT2 family glycosyltransferase
VKRLWVVVLNWNGVQDTLALLPTLERCRPPEGWGVTVLVVDNGSTDGSLERIAAAHPAVERLGLPENRRFAGGNNEGIRLALARGADAVMLLNNDTEADPALLERLVLALEQDPRAGAVGPLIYHAPPTDLIWYAGGECHLSIGLTRHRGLRRRDHGQYRSVEPTDYLTGCCVLARREVWEKVGLLDERYFIYAEDADWSLRARQAGYCLLFVPTARLWHKLSSSSGEASRFKIYHRLRAQIRLFARHSRGLARLTWMPGLLGLNVALAASLVARGHAAAVAAIPRALADAARGIPEAEARP